RDRRQVRRAQHPDDRLPQERRTGGQTGGRLQEGRPRGEARKTDVMIRTTDFYGLRAVEFSKGDYTALLVPEVGANLVRLAHVRLGAELLRTPAAGEIEAFRARPHVYGLPVLFPPNRIADGRYTFGGRTYRFPI